MGERLPWAPLPETLFRPHHSSSSSSPPFSFYLFPPRFLARKTFISLPLSWPPAEAAHYTVATYLFSLLPCPPHSTTSLPPSSAPAPSSSPLGPREPTPQRRRKRRTDWPLLLMVLGEGKKGGREAGWHAGGGGGKRPPSSTLSSSLSSVLPFPTSDLPTREEVGVVVLVGRWYNWEDEEGGETSPPLEDRRRPPPPPPLSREEPSLPHCFTT